MKSFIPVVFLLALVSCNRPSGTAYRSQPHSAAAASVMPSGPILSYADVVDRVAPAVVTIRATSRVRAPQQFPFFDDPFFRQFFGGGTPLHGTSVVGVLTRAALVRAMLNEGPEGYVAGAMDREFIRLNPEMPLSEALPRVSGPGACALVMDQEDRLMGILTSENLSEFVLLRQAAEAPHKARTV